MFDYWTTIRMERQGGETILIAEIIGSEISSKDELN